eukprot:gene4667-4920_t
MKPAALHLLQERAAAAGLSNIKVFEGMIEAYDQPFDVALALHACGNATDHVLQMAAAQGAYYIVSPCCVGKLKFSMSGGSSFHSSFFSWTPSLPGDKPSGSKPSGFSNSSSSSHHKHSHSSNGTDGGDQLGGQQHDQVADGTHAPSEQLQLADALGHRAIVADLCKRFVELDRCAAAAEAGYAVGLFKVLSAETMAKNDLLVGLKLTGLKPPAADVAVEQDAGHSSLQLPRLRHLHQHLQLQDHLLETAGT